MEYRIKEICLTASSSSSSSSHRRRPQTTLTTTSNPLTMSRPTLAASSKRLRLSVSSRFASTSALPPRTSRSNPDDLYDIKNIQKFEFDDTTSVGHLWLEQERERLALLRAIEQDRSVLERENLTGLRLLSSNTSNHDASSLPFPLQNNEKHSSHLHPLKSSALNPSSTSPNPPIHSLENESSPFPFLLSHSKLRKRYIDSSY